ncbi:dephospho-CoA kinase [Acetobacter lambici]|uniref:Dephospho-CoA kinase n=1 Tax=Acetobacter lambici TaxID=1332824 RepID=A0ABT1EWN4_9PROT|nr:dephospho-CoA kinase [Acetobacter lambici]MCP1243128.1 dephospho-CoA kinase [Acetobacter lambici]MCP1257360.1 dephospho-CoA kinase [Acetobacter lambici]NHO55848.1 dephospho-CoA kinase [Acetobacter lambici]
MRILGLTGGMGMGKSTVATMLRRAGLPVFDADAVVHSLQAPGGAALPPIARLVPKAVTERGLDRAALRQAVLDHPALLKKLEAIMHPLVRRARARFLRHYRQTGAACVVLDIPLLFETRADRLCDRVVVVSAPAWVQRRRVALRRNMPHTQARKLIACQMPDVRRRQKADAVIRTGLSMKETERQVRRFIGSLRA